MLWTRRGGSADGPVLVLVHGLGATADVWLGLEALLPETWAGGWLSVDLSGHGRSPWTPPYSFEAHASRLAEIVPDDRDLVLLGHSMGGMVALALAPHRPRTQRVIGFSIKTFWPEAHLDHMRRQAAREPALFPERSSAAGLYAKLSGLAGPDRAGPEHPGIASGIVETDAGWRLAQDPATFGFGVPDLPLLIAGLDCRVTLARGSEDHLVRAENLTDADDRVTLDGLGHNPHVEDPAAIAGLLRG